MNTGLPFLTYGVILRGRYVIDSVIGSGGFGVTYKAWDNVLNCAVAIKEYFPKSFVSRTPGDVSVSVFTDMNTVEFDHGMKRFLKEAQDLAKFNNRPGIVSVYDFFEANNTAYMVMEFLDGCTLKDYLKANGEKVNIDTGLYIIDSLLSVLADVHKAGIIHRDISPDNIFICTDSSVKLLDFGAAKQTMDIYNQTVSIVLKHGYAPPEQYFSKGEFGPWTDIYALGATMYRMFTGLMPTESVERMANDNMPAPNVVNPEIPQYLSNVIKKAMAVKVENRYRSVEDLRKDLVPNAVSDNSRVIKKIVAICAPIVGVAAIAICVLLGVQTSKNSKHKKYEATSSNDTTITEQKVDVDDEEKTTAAGTEEKKKPAVSDITGNNLTDAKIGPAGLTMPDEDSAPIYIYSWDDDLENKLQYVKAKYPEYASLIRYVNLGVGSNSVDYLNGLENAAEQPSIIASDIDVTYYFTESDGTIPLSEIGLTEDMYKNAFPYTVECGSVNGILKAMTWQSTPGCFVYRTDIAEKVFGASDPETVQSYVKDWSTFISTAEKLNNAGYKIVSGPDDIQRPILGSRTVKWVDGNKVNFDGAVSSYLSISKELYDGNYTNNSSVWDSTWFDGMTGNVFGYFGSPWFVYSTLNDIKGSETYGKRNVCQGPDSYYWGGTYLTVTAQCTNKELAALVLYTLCCDTDVMYQMQCDNIDFVNNTDALDRAISSGYGSTDILGGANPLSTWKNNGEVINSNNLCDYDVAFYNYILDASWNYNHGNLSSVDDAISQIKNSIKADYSNLQVD